MHIIRKIIVIADGNSGEGYYLKVYRFHSERHHLIEKKIVYMAVVLHLNNALLAKIL